jgi:hypothetical protein
MGRLLWLASVIPPLQIEEDSHQNPQGGRWMQRSKKRRAAATWAVIFLNLRYLS